MSLSVEYRYAPQSPRHRRSVTTKTCHMCGYDGDVATFGFEARNIGTTRYDRVLTCPACRDRVLIRHTTRALYLRLVVHK